jgi:predicted transcriptional regulator
MKIGRPKTPLNRKLRVDIRISENELAELDRLAETLSATRTDAIIEAVRIYLAILEKSESEVRK